MSKSLLPVVLFALNPISITQTLISGHNDITMIFFALGSYYALQKKWFISALILLFLSILIKYVTVILLPFFSFCISANDKKQKNFLGKNVLFFSICHAFNVFFFLYSIEKFILGMSPGLWSLVVSLLKKKMLVLFIQVLSISTLLTDIPYLYLGVYNPSEQYSKVGLAMIPMVCFGFYILLRYFKKFLLR